MIQGLKRLFSEVIYVQIWSERIRLSAKNFDSKYDEKSLVAIDSRNGSEEIVAAVGNNAAEMDSRTIRIENPFSEENKLISDTLIAKALVQHAFNCIFEGRFLPPSPNVVVQFMDKDIRSFTAKDRSSVAEVFEHAGARAVKLFVGNELDIEKLDFKDVRGIVQ